MATRVLASLMLVCCTQYIHAQRPGTEIAPYQVTEPHPIGDDLYANAWLTLTSYLNGRNDRGERMKMALPVIVQVRPQGDMARFMMCFYIPASHQGRPPRPSTPNTRLVTMPANTVLTRIVGGNMQGSAMWAREANMLKAMLQRGGERGVKTDTFIGAVYNAPVEVENRRNEVWFFRS